MTTTLTRDGVRTAGASGVLERRTRALADTDCRVVRADGDAAQQFVGHAAVFESRTTIGNPFGWGWYEEIARSAFDKTLSEGDARFLIDHNPSLLVARVSAGDLRLSTDGVGLLTDADLDPEVSYVRDFARNLEKRRITGMSFGFYVVRDTWQQIDVEIEVKGKTETVKADLRTIDEVRLLEVSGVTFPAYEDTDAGLRSDEAAEIRTARGVPVPDASQTSPAAAGARPAPADEATRDTTDPAPAQTTRGFDLLDAKAKALQVRYRL